MTRNHTGLINNPSLPPTRENILLCIRQIEHTNLRFGKAAAHEISRVRLSPDFGDFDATVEMLCDWIGANVEPMVLKSRRHPVTQLHTFLQPIMEVRVLYHHLAVAMQLCGYVVDYCDDWQWFRGNWKFAPHLRTFRRRLDYQARHSLQAKRDRMYRANVSCPPQDQ